MSGRAPAPAPAALALMLTLVSVSGLPTPQSAGADADFVVITAAEPREARQGRVLVADIPRDTSSFSEAGVRLPHISAARHGDAVVVEAAGEDEVPASGRFVSDIPRDRNFGVVAGPRLPLPEAEVVIIEAAEGRGGRGLAADIPRDDSAPDQAGFRLPLAGNHQENFGRSAAEDDFEIIEVGDYDYDDVKETGRSIAESQIPTDNSGAGRAGFRLPVAEAEADFLKPLAVSRCRAALVNWYYDTETAACTEFSFGGCDADTHSNRFESLEECQQVCLAAR